MDTLHNIWNTWHDPPWVAKQWEMEWTVFSQCGICCLFTTWILVTVQALYVSPVSVKRNPKYHSPKNTCKVNGPNGRTLCLCRMLLSYLHTEVRVPPACSSNTSCDSCCRILSPIFLAADFVQWESNSSTCSKTIPGELKMDLCMSRGPQSLWPQAVKQYYPLLCISWRNI